MNTVFQEASLLFKSPITEFTAFLKFPVGLTTTCVKKRKPKNSQLVADIYRFDFFASKKNGANYRNRQGGQSPTKSASISERNRQASENCIIALANGATRRYKTKNDGKIHFARQVQSVSTQFSRRMQIKNGANYRTTLAASLSKAKAIANKKMEPIIGIDKEGKARRRAWTKCKAQTDKWSAEALWRQPTTKWELHNWRKPMEQREDTKQKMTAKFILHVNFLECIKAILTKNANKKWSQLSESNRWPIHYEWIALPTELNWHPYIA